MSTKRSKITEEAHPFLPSGEWEGFYCYGNSMQQHRMNTEFHFVNSEVTGFGTDDVAPFNWEGKYDLSSFKLVTRKLYGTHQFVYRGDIDENGIWGIWESSIEPQDPSNRFQIKMNGGFHLWPKENLLGFNWVSQKTEQSEILKEIFLEEFA